MENNYMIEFKIKSTWKKLIFNLLVFPLLIILVSLSNPKFIYMMFVNLFVTFLILLDHFGKKLYLKDQVLYYQNWFYKEQIEIDSIKSVDKYWVLFGMNPVCIVDKSGNAKMKGIRDFTYEMVDLENFLSELKKINPNITTNITQLIS